MYAPSQMRAHRLWRIIAVVIVMAVAGCGRLQPDPGASARSKDGASLAPVSPRAAVRGFLVTMQVSAHDRPEEIADARRYLDLEWLEEEQRDARSLQLAVELFEVLDRLALDLDQFPTTTKRRKITIRTFAGDGEGPPLRLALTRVEDRWQFAAETLSKLDLIAAALEAERGADPGNSEVASELRSPRATMKTFLDAMDQSPPNIERASRCLQPSTDSEDAWKMARADQAHRLYAVLLRARDPVLSTIPRHPGAEHYIWYVHPRGRIVLEQMQADDPEHAVWRGEWRFSAASLAQIDELYEAHASAPRLAMADLLDYREEPSLGLRIVEQMPPQLLESAAGLELWQWMGAGVISVILLAVFLVGLLTAWVLAPLFRLVRLDVSDAHIWKLGRAIGYLGVGYTLHRFVSANTLLLPVAVLSVVFLLSRLLFGASALLLGLRLIDVADGHYQQPKRASSSQLATLLIPVLQSALRLMIGVLVIVFVLRLMGLSPAGVLGALGLIGAAVGLAARETLANAIAAISLLYDRPFRVGDWINFDGTDATVERVGLLTTRVRTFYNSVVAIPNAKLTTTSVDNYGERKYRRLKCYLRLRYDTPPAKIDAFCEGLRELVRLHPWTRKDYYHIYLNELTPSSADVMVYVFFDVPDWATELRERHRLLIDALALARELGIELAFPTHRVLLEQTEAPTSAGEDELGDPESIGRARAAKMFRAHYGDPPVPRGPVVVHKSPLTAGFDDDADGDGGDGD